LIGFNLIAEVYFRIGRTYEIIAQYQKAIDSYQIAVSLDQSFGIFAKCFLNDTNTIIKIPIIRYDFVGALIQL
jgi:tetratricopeptide (TPR) repeat protein